MAIETRRRQTFSGAIDTQPFSTWAWKDWIKEHVSIQWAVAPLFLLDALCVALSLAGAHYLRFSLLSYHGPYSDTFYTRLTLVAIPIWMVAFVVYRLYNPDHLFGGFQEYMRAINACTTALVGLILYSFLNRHETYDVSRVWIATFWALTVISVVGTRFLYRRLVYYLRRRGMLTRRALIIGANPEAREVAAQLCSSPSAGISVLGLVEPKPHRKSPVAGVPVLNGLHRLEGLIRSLNIEELIVIPTALRREELLNIYRDWGTDNQVRISLSSGLYELFTTGAEVREVGFVPLVNLSRTRITGIDALLKTSLDYLGSLIAIILLAPVFLVIAILVKLDSKGPVIYRRRVIGLHGEQFDAYKFRTMIPNAEAYLEAHPEMKQEWDQNGKIQHDPRITRVGHILRRYSLDELPQLFNILRGQMSLVGPRMITPAELDHFGHWQHNLMTVKPGLTGLWQTSGRSDLSYEERVRLDMYYIRNYTIWMDLKLVANTVIAVLKGQGAY
jgi:exopolysaccharide biosynthesis polyprenyl glycosylphosphotransferase